MNILDDEKIAIRVKNVSKSFRLYFDKGHMLKEKVLFKNRGQFEKHEILKLHTIGPGIWQEN